MKYDLRNELDRRRFIDKAGKLLEKSAYVELTEKTARTLRQNSYLHLILGAFAMEIGCTVEYVKEVHFKRCCNPGLFVKAVADKIIGSVDVLRSTKDLTKDEMRIAIDRFQAYAYENGIYLPQPGDEELLKEIEIQMGRNEQYL